MAIRKGESLTKDRAATHASYREFLDRNGNFNRWSVLRD
jgi:hypothetical protein